jgi:predicted NBD/HSP70 family sugar kinase
MRPHHVEPAPGSTSSLRTANQRRVLDVLRGVTPVAPLDNGDTESAFTQAELARATGLAPATVSNIVRELTASRLVEADPGSGRRGSAVRLARDAGLVAGVDFGHSHVAVAVGDLTGHLLAEERRGLTAGHGHAEALGLAGSMLDAMARAHGPVRHVGLGLPAPVTDNVVRSSAIFPGWEDIDTRAVAEQRFGVPVHVENDANLGALAEHRYGIARGHDTSVFVKISSGVGAGIIIDNRLFHGAGGTAGEIGHLTLDDQGPLCRCGSRGCLEAYTSTGTVQAMMAGQLPRADLDAIVVAAQSGNVGAQRALEDAGLHLGWGLASIVNLLNPAIVVVGGDIARAGELLLESARIGLRRHALDSVALTPVVASELGERASLVGAVLLAAERTELVVEHA